MDYGHKQTDMELAALEKRIAKIYSEASKDLQKTIDQYFAQFETRDKHQQELLKAGKITEEQYKQWRLNQIGRGERFKDLQNKVAERCTKANETAVAYVNDETPGIYSLNRNYAAYEIESVSGNVGFTLWDEQTVKRLIVEDPDLMPYYPKKKALNRGIDLAYGKKQISAQVTSGILQGLSIGKIANSLQGRLVDMNRASAIRTARTSVTGAQNAGRMESYAAAEKMGIELEREWVATLDNLTRHAHAVLDGQTVPMGKPFKVDGYEIDYPGDPKAKAYLVYNCRCTLVARVKGVKDANALRRAIDPVTGKSVVIPDMTYAQWEAWKKSENAYTWETYMKKGRNASSDRKQYLEYKKILGTKLPNTFEKFQDLKYNEPDKWESIKTLKRQTVFVKDAPCETTPRKYTGFFLKDGAKHAKDFLELGYTRENSMQLRYDMAKQFDVSKAVDFSTNDRGEEKFNIYMNLGINKQKRFRTCWQKDTPTSKPRIITAFRDDKE